MADREQIEIWKRQIAKYEEIYKEMYFGKRPSEKLIASFCGINGIPWPLPEPDEDEFDFLL